MKCLDDAQVQALADGEAADEVRRHAITCVRCGDRVRDRRKLTSDAVGVLSLPAGVPADVSRRIEHALADALRLGATRLRTGAPHHTWRPAAWAGGAAVAATLLGIFVVAPMFRGPSTVSASEILARSATRLAQPVTSGVELLEYELTLDGIPREMMPDHVDGAYRMKQVIDHDRPGRYFLATYDSNGQLQSSVAQDPALNRRVMTVRVDSQAYRFECTVPPNVSLSPPDLERLHMEATVAIMQTSGNQLLQVIDHEAGRRYGIEVPQVTAQTTNAVWDLTEAAVIIDASDYHIVELAVRGTFLKQPYSVSYRLISRTIAKGATIQASEFDAPVDPGTITIHGEGSAVPVRDALVLALRELARTKQDR